MQRYVADKKINEGEIQQYYVENSHPEIITPEVFELFQEEVRRRKSAGKHTSAINCFARNTLILLESVSELKAIGVGVVFEEQGINTLH